MARTFRFLRRTGRGLRSFLATVIGGLWLIALYSLTVWLVVGSLATFQIRNELRQMEGAPSFNDVKRAYEHYRDRERLIYADYYAELDRHYDLFSREGELDSVLAEIRKAVIPDSAESLSDFYNSVEFFDFSSQCEKSDFREDENCKLLTKWYELSKEYNIKSEQNVNVKFEQLWADATVEAIKLRANEPLTKHFDTYEFFANVKAEHEVLFDEAQSEGSPLSYFFLLHWPLQILVLLLTIIMGVLGSVLTMTWSFIKRDSDGRVT